jgi:16S rRNA (guanine527-N7)-methyltransferase
MSLAESLHAGILELTGAPIEPARVETLLAYVDLLLRWNRSYNLTAIRNPGEIISRHLLDSFSVMPFIDGDRLLDAGTGAGLPGVPLAIARPEWEVTLLDSAGKKIRFLKHVRRELGLVNICPLQERLETHRPESGYKEIISRAFASLVTFAAAARHLAPVRLLAMKGRYPDAELEELPAWVQVDSVEKLVVPGLQEERHLVIMSVNS